MSGNWHELGAMPSIDELTATATVTVYGDYSAQASVAFEDQTVAADRERCEVRYKRFVVGAKYDGVGLVAFEAQRGAGLNQRQQLQRNNRRAPE